MVWFYVPRQRLKTTRFVKALRCALLEYHVYLAATRAVNNKSYRPISSYFVSTRSIFIEICSLFHRESNWGRQV